MLSSTFFLKNEIKVVWSKFFEKNKIKFLIKSANTIFDNQIFQYHVTLSLRIYLFVEYHLKIKKRNLELLKLIQLELERERRLEKEKNYFKSQSKFKKSQAPQGKISILTKNFKQKL